MKFYRFSIFYTHRENLKVLIPGMGSYLNYTSHGRKEEVLTYSRIVSLPGGLTQDWESFGRYPYPS